MKLILTLLMAPLLFAHCDTLNGPVVTAGRKALETGDVRHALVWVQPAGEAAIRETFAKTLAVRKLNAQSRELADRYFFETLVRVHRAGESAPYTGLQEHARELPADQAIAKNSADEIVHHVAHGIADRLAEVKRHADYGADVAKGRAYVKAYVDFVHYVEALLKPGHH